MEPYHLWEEDGPAHEKGNHFFILAIPSLSIGIESYTLSEKRKVVYYEEKNKFLQQFIITLKYCNSCSKTWYYLACGSLSSKYVGHTSLFLIASLTVTCGFHTRL
jgi:hypothetical protein